MTSSETVAPDVENLNNRPGPDDPPAAWVAWANQTPQLRGLGIVCTTVGQGEAEFTIPTVPYAANPNGSVNGGMVAAIADQATGVLARMNSPRGQGTMIVGGAGRPQTANQTGDTQ